MSVREQTEGQTRVLFTSGATAHYNAVNEEQMQLSADGEGGWLQERGVACPGKAYMEVCPGIPKSPLSVQPKRSLFMRSATAISSTENCLAQ